jgi:hypothetical protein
LRVPTLAIPPARSDSPSASKRVAPRSIRRQRPGARSGWWSAFGVSKADGRACPEPVVQRKLVAVWALSSSREMGPLSGGGLIATERTEGTYTTCPLGPFRPCGPSFQSLTQPRCRLRSSLNGGMMVAWHARRAQRERGPTQIRGNPFRGNPFSGNPFSGNPFSGNPFSGNPFSGNPCRAHKRLIKASASRRSSPRRGSVAVASASN